MQDQILGKWKAGETGLERTVEFARDGKAKLTMLGKTLQGTYKLNGEELPDGTQGGQERRTVRARSVFGREFGPSR